MLVSSVPASPNQWQEVRHLLLIHHNCLKGPPFYPGGLLHAANLMGDCAPIGEAFTRLTFDHTSIHKTPDMAKLVRNYLTNIITHRDFADLKRKTYGVQGLYPILGWAMGRTTTGHLEEVVFAIDGKIKKQTAILPLDPSTGQVVLQFDPFVPTPLLRELKLFQKVYKAIYDAKAGSHDATSAFAELRATLLCPPPAVTLPPWWENL